MFIAFSVSADTCSGIKGLIHRNQADLKFYLMQDHYLYDQIQSIETERGERCFISEQEAISAGFFKLPNRKSMVQQQNETVSQSQQTPTQTNRANTQSQSSASSSDDSFAGVKADCVTKNGYFAAVSKEIFEQATNYLVRNDMVALGKLQDAGVVIMLKEGIPVYVEDSKFFSGIVEIRPAGFTQTLWTAIEAIECDF